MGTDIDEDTRELHPLISAEGEEMIRESEYTESRSSTALRQSADSSRSSAPSHVVVMDNTSQSIESGTEIQFEDGSGNPTRSLGYIFLLTLAIGGLQLSWSTEFSNGTPFLLSLGMSKTFMSLVWIAGPLSGVLVQPVVGMMSDSSQSRFGRRRPFMAVGSAFTILSLFALSWSKNIIYVLLGGLTSSLTGPTQVLAVVMVYVLDFSVGTVQASSRAFIVDNVPLHQQQSANAWAAILTGVGNILGFILGTLDLPHIFPVFGDTQFKCLCVFASLALIISVGLACIYIKEKDPRSDLYIREATGQRRSVTDFFKLTLRGVARLSPQVRLICNTEFFAWLGYFPMLFYTTTYVGEMYYQEQVHSRNPDLPPMTSHEIDLLWESATRYASLALLLYSITALVTNVTLPFVISESYSGAEPQKSSPFRIRWLTLPRSWMLSHITFAVAMFSTFFIRTGAQATVMVTLLGIPWAHALWAPFALIAEDISRMKSKLRHQQLEEYEHEAGIIMGVHNVFVSLPQVLSSLGSSILFKFLAKPRGEEDDNSIVWVFRLSGIGALVAIYLSTKIKTPDQLEFSDVFSSSDADDSDTLDVSNNINTSRA
ncbi:major facilitator superfamily domain-containing protein [Lipomyces arxii]|uniref:major facilitator superfamily domain-containing protein n=1 Tax=Lipomyces arxii TaxID=56418 RepID=UPI0034CEE323